MNINLQAVVRKKLWETISKAYEAGNYSHAIIDAMQLLSNVLREKSGVDDDGVSLVGKALGGDSPKLKVNKLQTGTERNVQKGLEQMLRGMYLGIRNPRSHEQIEDTKEDADAIIVFINYILSILEISEEPFTIQKFKSRVFDPDYVETERYTQLLVKEIPENKRLDTLIEIFRDKGRGDGRKLKFMVEAILQRLSNEQQNEFFNVVSEDLKTESSAEALISLLQIISPSMWYRIEESARIRLENKLIKSIKEGEMNHFSEEKLNSGAFGTWASKFLGFFNLQTELKTALIRKLRSENQHERRYLANYFLAFLPDLFTTDEDRKNCVRAISWAVRRGGSKFNEKVIDLLLDGFPETWYREIVVALQDATDTDNPGYYLPDGSPFLGKIDEHDDVESFPF